MLSALVRVAARGAAIQLEEATASASVRQSYKGKERAVEGGLTNSALDHLDLQKDRRGNPSKRAVTPLSESVASQQHSASNRNPTPCSHPNTSTKSDTFPQFAVPVEAFGASKAQEDWAATEVPVPDIAQDRSSAKHHTTEKHTERPLDELVAAELSSPGAGPSKLPETVSPTESQAYPISEPPADIVEDEDEVILRDSCFIPRPLTRDSHRLCFERPKSPLPGLVVSCIMAVSCSFLFPLHGPLIDFTQLWPHLCLLVQLRSQ